MGHWGMRGEWTLLDLVKRGIYYYLLYRVVDSTNFSSLLGVVNSRRRNLNWEHGSGPAVAEKSGEGVHRFIGPRFGGGQWGEDRLITITTFATCRAREVLTFPGMSAGYHILDLLITRERDGKKKKKKRNGMTAAEACSQPPPLGPLTKSPSVGRQGQSNYR